MNFTIILNEKPRARIQGMCAHSLVCDLCVCIQAQGVAKALLMCEQGWASWEKLRKVQLGLSWAG